MRFNSLSLPFFFLFVGVPLIRVSGQNAAGSGITTSAATTNPSGPPSVKVVAKSVHGIAATTWSSLGNPVTVPLDGLYNWSKTSGNDPNDLRLFLGGRMLAASEPILVNREEEYVNFRLEIKPEDRDKWVDIFTQAIRLGKYDLSMSVGPKQTNEPFQSREKIHLQVYPDYTIWVVLLLFGMLGCLVSLAYRSDLLRDGPATDMGKKPTTPFSLGRVQMAWWFFLIIAAYLYVWLITGDYNTPNSSILALMGISATTALAAVAVDRNKAADLSGQRNELEAQQAALTSRIVEIEAGSPGADSTLDKELQMKKSQVKEVAETLLRLDPIPATQASKGFVRDLLQDGSGVSFHRFQIVVWTIVLGIVFVSSIYQKLAMPDFNAGLLGLLGISSGTYIGFKFPETPK